MATLRQSEASLAQREPQFNDVASSSSQLRFELTLPSRSDSGQNQQANATPASGGSAAMQRSRSANSRNASAADASAASVNVKSAASAGTPNVAASSSASQLARGASSVPTSAAAGGGGGGPAMQLSRSGLSALQAGTAGRNNGATTGPQLGDAVGDTGGGLMRGGSARGNGAAGATDGVLGSVNSRADGVTIGGVAAAGGSSEQVLAGGPSGRASNVGRSEMGLPAGNFGAGTGYEQSTAGSSSGGLGMAMNSSSCGLSGRATEPSASLGGSITGNASALSGRSARRSASIALPAAALAAESSGQLVITGPRSQGGGSGLGSATGAATGSGSASGLTGPRSTSVARRSSSLPGGIAGPPSMSSSRAQLPGLAGPVASSPRSAASVTQPRIATGSEVAAMFRRSVPGISPIPTERISAGFSMRTPQARAEAIDKLGGSDASETAVDRGLEWLAEHQFAAGNWSIHEINCKGHNCTGAGSYQADPAATGLALLAFLGAGHTHKTGDYQQTVERGLSWLLNQQKTDGDLFPVETEFAWFYSHGIASIAVCEAYGMTKDARLRDPAQRALEFIVASQHPEFGGWRYRPRFESDTSVSGWQLMALKSGEMAGLKVPRSAYDNVGRWLDSVEDKAQPGRFSYHPSMPVTDTMTAEGLLMRQYLGAGREDSNMLAGASFLRQRLPRESNRDVYYWYYATQVMFHMQGDYWNEWNTALRDMLIDAQDKTGEQRGSWNPEAPTKDEWGKSGGRHYVTCMNLLMLEVYYRHLPLYLKLDE